MISLQNKILQSLIILWIAVAPFFWRFDLSKISSGYYDIFFMAPYAIIHISVFFVLMAISLYFKKSSLFNILMLSFYYPVVIISNYPFLTFRDVYLHAGPARAIMLDGNLGGIANTNPAYWPLSYVLHAMTSIVTASDLIIANYVLYLSLSLLMALVFYLLSRMLIRKGYTWAWICPVLFLALYNSNLFAFSHYARAHFALVLFFFFSLLILRFADSERSIDRSLVLGSILIPMIAILTMVQLHPFQSLYLMLFLLFTAAIVSIKKIRTLGISFYLALFSIVMFFAYWIFVAGASLQRLGLIGRSIFDPEYVQPIVQTLSVSHFLPWWGQLLRDYFRFSLLGLLLLGCVLSVLILFRRRTKTGPMPMAITVFISTLVVSILFLPVFLTLPGWGISRFIAFAAFPAAFSSFVCLDYLRKHRKHSRRQFFTRKLAAVFLVVFLTTLSFSTMVLRFESNQYFGELEHSSTFPFLDFVAEYSEHPLTITMSQGLAVRYVYFDYNSTDTVNRFVTEANRASLRNANETDLVSLLGRECRKSELVLTGLQDRADLAWLSDEQYNATMTRLSCEVLDSKYSRICDSGYYQLYRDTSASQLAAIPSNLIVP